MTKKYCKTTCDECTHGENQLETMQFKKWIKEGRCPKCGHRGQFVNFQTVCPEHGPYKLFTVDKDCNFDGGDCWKDSNLENEEKDE